VAPAVVGPRREFNQNARPPVADSRAHASGALNGRSQWVYSAAYGCAVSWAHSAFASAEPAILWPVSFQCPMQAPPKP
jgi:hypothetical protein